MLEEKVRALHQEEVAILEKKLRWLRRRVFVFHGFSTLSVAGLGVLGFFLYELFILGEALPFFVAIVGVVYLIFVSLFVGIYTRTVWNGHYLIANYKYALAANSVKVVLCQAHELMCMRKDSLRGPDYFFGTAKGQVLWVDGSFFNSIENFPNSAFEIVEVVGKEGSSIIWEQLTVSGELLEPAYWLSKRMRNAFYENRPRGKHFLILEGNLASMKQRFERK